MGKQTWHLQLEWRSAPSIGDLSVLTFPVQLDESITPFKGGKETVFPKYQENGKGIQLNAPIARRLDAEFYLDEFMKLDPTDIPALVNFMSTYGVITNPHRDPLVEPMRASVSVSPLREERGDGSLSRYPTTSNEEAQTAAKEMYDSVNSAHHRILEHAYLSFPKATYKYAPIEECISAAQWLQDVVRRLTREKGQGSHLEGEWLSIQARSALRIVEEVVGVVNPYFPLARAVMPEERDALATPYGGAPGTVTLPTTIAILTQLLIGLSEDEGYKVCPVCGRTFMYKRGRAGTVARRSNSTYCSDYCQRKANHDKDARKSHSRGYYGRDQQ